MSKSSENPVQDYLRSVERSLRRGDATEHTHRPALKRLLEQLMPGTDVVNEPKRIDCGAPDYIVARGSIPLGYVEAKDVGIDLTLTERSEQLLRYRDSLGNLVLTDYLEFRWHVDGERRLTAKLADWDGKKLKPHTEGQADFETLIAHFHDAQIPIIGQAKELARRMAALTRLIKRTVIAALGEERKKATERNQDPATFPLQGQIEAFREILIPDLSETDFADMHAQTLAYGLFAARMNKKCDEEFTWKTAQTMLPRTNPFLAKTFARIWVELDEAITWTIEDLSELLNRTDMDAILEQFRGPTRRGDPIVHFYETFLGEYDPATREARGVYYTPGPVVSYMVHSVDELLRNEFGLADGLADSSMLEDGRTHRIQLLDPACGTGTFLHAIIDHIYRNAYTGNEGLWPSYVRKHLVPRLHGFELLMAPYAVAHMKLDLLLKDTEAELGKGERFGVYLTNALEEPHTLERPPLFAQWLTDEARAAAAVKRQTPIMVVIGNPPYAEPSMNPSQRKTFVPKGSSYEVYEGRTPVFRNARQDVTVDQRTRIGHLLRGWDSLRGERTFSYFHLEEKSINEANPKALNNDFVKFLRFSQWRVDRTGAGIIAFITDNVFLEGAIFRAMRKALIDDFDSIYVLNLHGSTLEPLPPEHQPDQNVFGITLGVCITFLVKRTVRTRGAATVFYASVSGPLKGKGKGKFDWLETHSLKTTAWKPVDASSPHFIFKPRRTDASEWKTWVSVEDMFIRASNGFKTHRDHFAVSFGKEELRRRMLDLVGPESDNDLRNRYELNDNRDWSLSEARRLARISNPESDIASCLYRPFDYRFCLLSKVAMDRPRTDAFQRSLFGKNLYLGVGRQGKAVNDSVWNLALISDVPVDTNAFRRGGVAIFPLFVAEGAMFGASGTVDNLKVTLPGRSKLETIYYIYSVLHSPEYRVRYGDFLRTEFPRIPLADDLALRSVLIELGHQLVQLHLGRMAPPTLPAFPVRGDSRVEKVRYAAAADGHGGRIWINRTQFFDGIEAAVWDFRVGGYPVAEKWLKDRQNDVMDLEALQHYRTIIGAIRETIRLQAEIDSVIDRHGGWALKASVAEPANLVPA